MNTHVQETNDHAEYSIELKENWLSTLTENCKQTFDLWRERTGNVKLRFLWKVIVQKHRTFLRELKISMKADVYAFDRLPVCKIHGINSF